MIYLFVLGRILLGGYFIMSGFNHFKNHAALSGYAQSKGVPMAKLSVWVTGLMMLIGGFGILLGAWVNLSIALLALFLLSAAFMMHPYWKATDEMSRMNDRINFMKNLALAGAILMLLMIPLPWAAAPLMM